MPSPRVFSFTDPDEYQSAVLAGDVELFVCAANEFRSRLVLIELNRALDAARRSESSNNRFISKSSRSGLNHYSRLRR